MGWKNWPYWVRTLFIISIPYLIASLLLTPVFVVFDSLQFITFYFLLSAPLVLTVGLFIGFIIDCIVRIRERRLNDKQRSLNNEQLTGKEKKHSLWIPLIILSIIIFLIFPFLYYKTGGFFNKAIEQNSIELCNLVPINNLLSGNDRRQCYIDLVIKNKNAQICKDKELSDLAFGYLKRYGGGDPQDECWFELAKRGGKSFCNYINDEKRKSLCLAMFINDG